MDYSLLVGIHDKLKAEEEAAQTEMARSGGDQGIVRGETSDSEECDSGERYDDSLVSFNPITTGTRGVNN